MAPRAVQSAPAPAVANHTTIPPVVRSFSSPTPPSSSSDPAPLPACDRDEPPVHAWPRPQPNTGNSCHLAAAVNICSASPTLLAQIRAAAAPEASSSASPRTVLARLLLACMDGRCPLSELDAALFAVPRQQDSPDAALAALADILQLRPGHHTFTSRHCTLCQNQLQAGDKDEEVESAPGMMLLYSGGTAQPQDELGLEGMVLDKVGGTTTSHQAHCPRHPQTPSLHVETHRAALTGAGPLLLQVLRQPGAMNNKDPATFLRVRAPTTLDIDIAQVPRRLALVAFSIHNTGDDGLSGHWYSCMRNSVTGQWWLCDDAVVSPLTPVEAARRAAAGTHFVYEPVELISVQGPENALPEQGHTDTSPAELTYNLTGFLEAMGMCGNV